MIDSLTALFVRAMRQDNRKITTYVTRFAVVGMVLFLLAVNQQSFRFGGGAPGLYVFQNVTLLNLAIIFFVGLGYFAAAITEEKEDGTLGLLRMTNMSPLAILLGKSTSRLITILLLLATQLPFISLAVALGGVSLHQILFCYLVLGAFTFLLGNLALFFSVICRRTTTAVGATLGVLFTFLVILPFIANLLEELFGVTLGLRTLWLWIVTISPFSSLDQIFDLQARDYSYSQPLWNVGLGFAFFFLSWVLFDVFNQGEGRNATPKASKFKRSQKAERASNHLRYPRPGIHAVAWRDFYFQGGGLNRLILSFVLILAIVGLITIYSVVMGANLTDVLSGGHSDGILQLSYNQETF